MSFMKKVCYAPIAVSASKCFLIRRCHIRITLKIVRYVVGQLFFDVTVDEDDVLVFVRSEIE